MPAPRNIALDLDGADHTDGAALWAWQLNPLTITATLVVDLMEDVDAVWAEIKSSAIPGGTLLAAAEATVDEDTYTFDWTTAEMSIGLSGKKKRKYYLFITARDALGVELQTLYAGAIEIRGNGYSGSDVEAPDPLVYQPVISVTANIAVFTAVDGNQYQFPVAPYP